MARKARAKKPVPKAVRVFQENAHRFPARSWWARVVDVVGEDEEDLTFWGLVVFHYVGRGWNPTNAQGMLDFYRRGRVPGMPGLDRDEGSSAVDQRLQRETVDLQVQSRPIAVMEVTV